MDWLALAATVGSVVAVAVIGVAAVWAFMAGAHALSGDDDGTTTTPLRMARPARPDAGVSAIGGRGGEGLAMHQLRQDVAARLADRKREAAEARRYRIVRPAQVVKFQR